MNHTGSLGRSTSVTHYSLSQTETGQREKTGIRIKPNKSIMKFKELRKFTTKTSSFGRHQGHGSRFEIRKREKSSSILQSQNQEQLLLTQQEETSSDQAVDTFASSYKFNNLFDLMVDVTNDQEKSNALKPRLHEQVLSESHETQPGANSTVNCPEVPLRRSIFNVTCSLCKVCGQNHRLSENHEYVYENDVDSDLLCGICLQPFVNPYDTKCGHTFCWVCLKNFVKLKKACPVDRSELTFV